MNPPDPTALSDVRAALDRATRILRAAGVDSPRLDAEILLAHCLDDVTSDRSHLIAHPDLPLTPAQIARYTKLIQRRAAREPLAYLTGRRWFFGLELLVTPAVLIPRPETELLVEKALAWLASSHLENTTVIDVGAGSGAIAIAVAVHTQPTVTIFASELSPAALAVAQANACQHCPDRITFLSGGLLTPLAEPVDLILANLPYIAETERPTLMPEVRDHEPDEALFGGDDGLRLIERLLAQAPDHIRPHGALMLEIGASQGETARQMARRHFPPAAITILPDLAGHDRLLVVQTP